ncbi:acyl-CoA dehydrogenase family protein [Paenibacillus roseipurpureus]|uniref:Acyl-CoA dehydrogenase n=1 Tax=Paenibacillus roseopurpureus TaxID=2918901 RepID=A0AA96LYB5_9BACL|nr:acyl-CoA dehydrogenase family protein [Paenibacillus sp. MBLB1832]WNR46765.1 acyl-CoA dehydrogenase family protein [Paenibacillus sp. MBLB1832]
MQLTYTLEQNLLRTRVREFALSELAPTAAQRDEEERFDRHIFGRLGELGYTGIPWATAVGGKDEPFLNYAMVIEELSRVCASTGVMLSVHTSLASWAVETYGTDAQKQAYLRPMAEGKLLGAYCLTESESGSDASAMRTTATRHGDQYELNGSKLFVSNGGEAEVYIVFALTDPGQGQKGISAFIVEKGFPGLIFGKKEKKLGIRSSTTVELRFEQCCVPAANLLGGEGEGFRIAMRSLDGGRIGIAAQAVGIAQGALDAGLAYVNEGRATKAKGTNGAHLFRYSDTLSELISQVEGARLLMYQAAWRKGNGMSYGKQAAMAKLFASDTAVRVTNEILQMLSRLGCMQTQAVERYFRDAKVTQIYEGTNEIQRIVISRMLLTERV